MIVCGLDDWAPILSSHPDDLPTLSLPSVLRDPDQPSATPASSLRWPRAPFPLFVPGCFAESFIISSPAPPAFPISTRTALSHDSERAIVQEHAHLSLDYLGPSCMMFQNMASQFETSITFREVTPRTFSPEPDTHRGRKRHRSLTRRDLEATHYGGTGESSTLRGRPRRRSTSLGALSSRASSRAIPSTSVSPMRKRLLRIVLLDRRRSQSPSRSRSPNHQQAPPRRRHRTRSRSRTHTKEMYQAKDQLPRPRQEQLYTKAGKSAQD